MRLGKIRFGISCLGFISILIAMSLYYSVLRSHLHMIKIIRGTVRMQVTTPGMKRPTKKSLRTQPSPSRLESAFRKQGYADSALMQKTKHLRPLFNFTMAPWKIKCNEEAENATQKTRWSMIVGVKSGIGIGRRNVIRRTWASYKLFNEVRLKVFFVVESSDNAENILEIQDENKEHGDILQIDMSVKFQDIALKALAAMQWVSENCQPTWMYSASDDNMIPDLASLYNQIGNLMLATTSPQAVSISCGHSFRDEDLGMQLSKNTPFCTGGFYTMPIELSTAIYATSRWHKIFANDGAWITGLLRLSVFNSDPDLAKKFSCANEYCGISRNDYATVRHFPKPDKEFQQEWKKIEKSFLARGTKVESAFRRLGYADVDLMQKMKTPRPLFNFSLTPWKVMCNDETTHNSTEPRWSMIVASKSHVEHFDNRERIRKTWGSYKMFMEVRLEVIFVIGSLKDANEASRLKQEDEKYGDLLQIDKAETYREVGLKAISAMQWVGENCPSHWIYTSADDDVVPNLVSVYKLIDNLRLTSPDKGKTIPLSCASSFRDYDTVIRQRHRNQVPKEVFPHTVYPAFCTGGFYSMSVWFSTAIYRVSRHHKYFYNDDVWITGLLRLSLFDSAPAYAKNFTCDITSVYCGISRKDPAHAKHIL